MVERRSVGDLHYESYSEDDDGVVAVRTTERSPPDLSAADLVQMNILRQLVCMTDTLTRINNNLRVIADTEEDEGEIF